MPQCRLSTLRNGSVPCHYFLNVPVDFNRVQCHLSNLRKCHVALSNLRVKGPYKLHDSYRGGNNHVTQGMMAQRHAANC